MKLKFNFFQLNLITLFLIIITIDIILTNNHSFSSFMETGIEEDLLRLISKIQNQKQQQKKEKEKNFIDVKVETIFDIKEYLNILETIKFKNEKEKDDYKKSLENLKIKIENNVGILQIKLKQIQSKYDQIIEKNNNLSKELNEKKIKEVKAKANFDLLKSEVDTKNDKLNTEYKNFKKNFEKKNEDFTDFNKKISNIHHLLRNQRISKSEFLQQKKEQKYLNNETNLNNKLLKEEESDKKFFDLINTNISKEAKEINLASIESNVKIQNLRKISFDDENHKKLEMEKDQQHEYSREYNKKIKELLKNHEKIENDIKDLMIKKNKLKVDINRKEIENNLKRNEFKNELNNITNNIKKTENEMLNNIKEQKKVQFFYIKYV